MPAKKSKKSASRGVEQSPVLPLKDLVLFPNQVMPIFVSRPRSMAAVEEASRSRYDLVIVAQKNAAQDEPGPADVYPVGVVAEVLQVLRLPDGMRVLVEAKARVRLERVFEGAETLRAEQRLIDDRDAKAQGAADEAALRSLLNLFEEHVKLHPKLPAETFLAMVGIEHPGRLADAIAAQLTLRVPAKQRLLETLEPLERLKQVSEVLTHENQVLALERQISGRVRKRIERGQRDAYLQEQLRAIQQELGNKNEEGGEIAELRGKVKALKASAEVKEKALKELGRLERTGPLSAEGTVIRTYLDWVLALPWEKRSKETPDLAKAKAVLEEDHEGLEKPKTRVLEYLAVRQLVEKQKGPILCFVGPPGVGKTSLARGIARALGRKFERVSLGGVRDESEIRGHRRTYVGALPGRLVQGLKRAGVKNPVILLDEIDKMSSDFRGDPASALLEVLDSEQNHAFQDHYLDLPVDLSEVLFVCTANVLYEIPGPLRDRLEVIEIPGYLETEKLRIAKRFLLPRTLKDHGLTEQNLRVNDEAISKIIRDYTREAGVRELERQLAALCRKAALLVIEKGKKSVLDLKPTGLATQLGIPRYQREADERRGVVGVATGLAWTGVGGETLSIEALLMPGKGSIILTGTLGDVMKESAHAALSWLRAHAAELGISDTEFKKRDIHVHVPEGGTPKDGPSAGIAMATALASALTGRPVRGDVAMTGEITLRGRVLPIGGLKEKSLAALRSGIKTLLIPRANRKDLEEVPLEARKAMSIHLVASVDQVLRLALEPKRATTRARRAADRAVPDVELWREQGARH